MPSLHAFSHMTAKNKNKTYTKTQVFKFINIKPKISTVMHKNLLALFCVSEGLVLFCFILFNLSYNLHH